MEKVEKMLCKLSHGSVHSAVFAFSSSTDRPSDEVQFCIFSQWIVGFFPFSPSVFSLLLESLILACPLFIPSRELFFSFSSLFSGIANLFFKAVPL